MTTDDRTEVTIMENTYNTVPIWEKYTLSIEEAAKYYGVGTKKLYDIIRNHRGADFLLEVGSHYRIKRELFERFLDDVGTL